MPKVSILLAAYNEERFLAETLDSLMAQTFQDFELICVNDGSADRTAEILETFAGKDTRVRIVTHETSTGLTKALNEALDIAQGAFIARADADDVYHPDRLEKQLAFFEAHPEVVLLSTQRVDIDEQGHVLAVQKSSPLSDTGMRWRMLFDSPCLHPVVMWRASVNLRYDESFKVAQDYELWSRMASVGKMAALPERLLFRRVHKKSVSSQRAGEQKANRNRVSAGQMSQVFGPDAPEQETVDRWRTMFVRNGQPPTLADLQGYAALLHAFCKRISRKKAALLKREEGRKQALSLLKTGHLLKMLVWRALVYSPCLARRATRPLSA